MRSVLHEEVGAALGLAVMVVVVIGVIGAGLLVFARNDLEAVIRVNQGQNAFYAADAGIEAAKRQLLGDASPASYDADNVSGSCNSLLDGEDPVSSEWSRERGGARRSFANGEFVAEIRWMGTGCGFPSGGDSDAEYFEVVSTGISGEAKRRVEAVFATSDTDAPLANYAGGDVQIRAGAVVSGVSVFSGEDVVLGASGSLRAIDRAYDTWRTEDGTERTENIAGVGAVGAISGGRARVGRRDFDGGSSPPFVEEPSAGELSFPFDPDFWRDGSALAILKEEATSQRNYRDSGGSLSWPENSSESTVVYVEFEELLPGTVELTSTACPLASGCRGVLVVENGSVVMKNGSALRGAVVAAGGERPDALSVVVENGATLEGSVSSSGTMDVRGTIRTVGRKEAIRRPGFHAMEIWSWRELYE